MTVHDDDCTPVGSDVLDIRDAEPPEVSDAVPTTPELPQSQDETLQELPVTLEIISAQVRHSIRVLEIVSNTSERLDREWDVHLGRMKEQHTHMRGIADTLYDTSVKLLTARAIAATIPSASKLGVSFAGAALGAACGVWIWLTLHGSNAIASMGH